MKQLLAELHKRGIRLQRDGNDLRIAAKPGALDAQLRDSLRQHKSELLELLRAGALGATEGEVQLVHDAEGRHAPFPLTELQHAYWLGRDAALDMGSVATHLYVELACDGLDLARANAALVQLIERHDMLRAVVQADGQQVVLPTVPRYEIATTDCSGTDTGTAETAAVFTRDKLSHQVLRADRWPLFDVRATRMPGGQTRLHVSLDLLILDAWSIFLFFREWHRLYQDPAAGVTPSITYRDYLHAERRSRELPRYQAAQAYWEQRVPQLPAAPDLPVRADPAARRAPRFQRREMRMDKARWDGLKALARTRGLTPSALLLAAYAEVLARWSAAPSFTLNVTTGARQPWHADVHHLLGDFTSLVLHEVNRTPGQSFADFALRQQERLLQDLEHGHYSGVSVRREWARQRGTGMQAAMPVVFSSGLVWSGDEEVGNLEQFGRKVFSISQTSQVWLDHHVMELGGDLVLIWDAAEGVFEPGVLDAMFEAYTTLVQRLADEPALWEHANVTLLPAEMARRRSVANDTTAPAPREALHAGFVKQALERPQALAVVAADRQMSYGELLGEAAAVADWLLAEGLQPEQTVAVITRKGWEQPVAVFGTLLAGGTYVPIDADLPMRRQEELVRLCGARHVLTQADTLRGELAQGTWHVYEIRAGQAGRYGPAHAPTLHGAPDRLAYVIFTSGTTGVPKGVMIDHAGAVNTVAAINRMFDVGPDDRVLGVSSLSFDLSVYDIFGVLAAGGTLVLPDPRVGHDPMHWHQLMQEHGVTLWNSAPQLLRMLVDTLEHAPPSLQALRTVLLSGDFIPLDLPERLRRQGCDGRITSLGGATEASIWSIYHPIGEVQPHWQSIPYGRALPNQTMWVLDSALQATPDHVRGRIFIGGIGLAKGYLGDEAKTAQRFIVHPATGHRLYDTGDLGRYDASGDIVILGRDDGQVKIRGHRVELSEIESVLRQHEAVDQAVVLARTHAAGTRQLVAYVVPAAGPAHELDVDGLRAFVAERLPDYMVPRHVLPLQEMPLSSNGKVNAAALPDIDLEAAEAGGKLAPRTPREQAVLEVWRNVIPGLDIGVADNFFELGGDSVLATQLLREINTALGVQLEMHELFENLTIEALARLLDSRAGQAHEPAPADEAAPSHADAQGGLLATVQQLEQDVALASAGLPAAASVTPAALGTVLLTGATGGVGSRLLAELLGSTSAQVVCLVRGASDAEARQRLLLRLDEHGIALDASQLARVSVLAAELQAPRFGLSGDAWHTLAGQVDAVFHLAASVGVLQPYAVHRQHNVLPVAGLLSLAKPIFTLSPMTVCRRQRNGQVEMLADETVNGQPEGLLTGYAQSKWVAEQALWQAASHGLPVRIYRSSHVLPATQGGRVLPQDTTMTVLSLARQVDVVPQWPEARVHGVPVDRLCELMVEDAVQHAHESAVVHLEHLTPPSLAELLDQLVRDRTGQVQVEQVSLQQWQQHCLGAAGRLPPSQESLARGLFEMRQDRMPVQHIFAGSEFHTGYVQQRRLGERLSHLTSPDYWRRVLGPSAALAAASQEQAFA